MLQNLQYSYMKQILLINFRSSTMLQHFLHMQMQRLFLSFFCIFFKGRRGSEERRNVFIYLQKRNSGWSFLDMGPHIFSRSSEKEETITTQIMRLTRRNKSKQTSIKPRISINFLSKYETQISH